MSFSSVSTVFLDVGNTLISIDFTWVADELTARGHTADAEMLRRAEAAARPAYSHRIFVEGLPPGADPFAQYLRAMLVGVPPTARLDAAAFDALVAELRAVLRPDGRASVLWRSVMPRVPEALARLRDRGLRLVVVSNSDGTVERSLDEAGLLPFMSAVIDSRLVGFEKPDPRIFHAALERSGADPARTLHIGDLYHADVQGARGAGIEAVLLDPYGDWPPGDFTRVRDLWEAADLLDR